MSEPNPPLPRPESAESVPSSTFELYRPIEVFVPKPPRRRIWLHALLFLLTVFTTLVVGARLQYNFHANLPAFPQIPDDASIGQVLLWWFPVRWALSEPSRLLMGVPFSATLLFILFCHEMGHYLYCVRYRVYATLPFFIPAPTLIGTLGAVIRIKSPIRDRRQLFDIGIAGPIAGFVVGVVALTVALLLSKRMPMGVGESAIALGYPEIFHVVQYALRLFGSHADAARLPLRTLYLHPTALAAWVGMFATALNLLPGGQLDGGHIVYAVKPYWHRGVSLLTILTLLYLTRYWSGWGIWSLLLLVTGMRHPNIPREPSLGAKRYALALFGLLMFLLTFMRSPFPGTGIGSLR